MKNIEELDDFMLGKNQDLSEGFFNNFKSNKRKNDIEAAFKAKENEDKEEKLRSRKEYEDWRDARDKKYNEERDTKRKEYEDWRKAREESQIEDDKQTDRYRKEASKDNRKLTFQEAKKQRRDIAAQMKRREKAKEDQQYQYKKKIEDRKAAAEKMRNDKFQKQFNDKRSEDIKKGAIIVGGVAVAAGLAAGITALVKRYKKKKAEATVKSGDEKAKKEALKAKLAYMQEIKKAGEKTNKMYEKAGKQSKADTNQQKIDDIEARIQKTKEKLNSKNK